MPIDKIAFEISQEYVNRIGLRSWKKFHAAYTLDAGETKEDARKALKEFVYESIKKQPEEVIEEVPVINPRPTDKIEGIIYDINSVTDLTVLKSYSLIAKSNPKIQEAYNNKLNQLSK